eukprot:TRINITY_DN7590_c0_g1_i1.p1 TRINITY_DN7590_c0_g1~~TRINITY_DN7590_c0_g1_i1.p1  ORF type:complete len:387 (+),score=76.31 TRINITY_DN7590_c0_g1_i1:93-1163(+)
MGEKLTGPAFIGRIEVPVTLLLHQMPVDGWFRLLPQYSAAGNASKNPPRLRLRLHYYFAGAPMPQMPFLQQQQIQQQMMQQQQQLQMQQSANPSANRSTSHSTSKKTETFPCPICGRQFKETEINEHAEKCIEAMSTIDDDDLSSPEYSPPRSTHSASNAPSNYSTSPIPVVYPYMPDTTSVPNSSTLYPSVNSNSPSLTHQPVNPQSTGIPSFSNDEQLMGSRFMEQNSGMQAYVPMHQQQLSDQYSVSPSYSQTFADLQQQQLQQQQLMLLQQQLQQQLHLQTNQQMNLQSNQQLQQMNLQTNQQLPNQQFNVQSGDMTNTAPLIQLYPSSNGNTRATRSGPSAPPTLDSLLDD